jgi:hypothetical protein
LCCNGALHASVTVRLEHVRLVRNLGLTIEKTDGDEVGFRQPCPLYQKDRCSVYPHHPPTCQEYRCALLQKYADGDVTLEDSLAITRTAKELLADRDGEHDLRGSGALRQANPEVVLRAVAFDIYRTKHFRLPSRSSHCSVGADARAGDSRLRVNMAVSFSQRVRVAPDVLFRFVGEEGVLVNLNTELSLTLNPVGTRMWSVLSSASSIQAAYDELLQEYEIEPAQLRADLEEFIDQLLGQKLIDPLGVS